VRIGVCSDIHGRDDRLGLVLADMEAADVEERWCLGDLVGAGSQVVEVVRLARSFELGLVGNHDVWMLMGRAWPADAQKLRGRDAVWLSSLKPLAERHAVKCWHGSPTEPLLGFLDTSAGMDELAALAPGTRSLVGHTHVPIAYVRDRDHFFEISAEPGKTVLLDPRWAVVANPGAVGGGDDPLEPWWLELELDLDGDERRLGWHSAAAAR
jgi:predicted phosphodiesterase